MSSSCGRSSSLETTPEKKYLNTLTIIFALHSIAVLVKEVFLKQCQTTVVLFAGVCRVKPALVFKDHTPTEITKDSRLSTNKKTAIAFRVLLGLRCKERGARSEVQGERWGIEGKLQNMRLIAIIGKL